MNGEIAPIHTPNADCSIYDQTGKPELIIAFPDFSWYQNRRPLKFSLHIDMCDDESAKRFNLKWFLTFISSEIENMVGSGKELTREEARQKIRAKITEYKISSRFDVSIDEYNEGRRNGAIKIFTPQIILTRGSSIWSVECRVGEKKEKVMATTKLCSLNTSLRDELKKSIIKDIIENKPKTEDDVYVTIETCIDNFKQKYSLGDVRRKPLQKKIDTPITVTKVPPVTITGPYFDFEEGRNAQVEFRINQEGRKEDHYFFSIKRSLGVSAEVIEADRAARNHAVKYTRLLKSKIVDQHVAMIESAGYASGHVFFCKINSSGKGSKLCDATDIANFTELASKINPIPKFVSTRLKRS